MSHKPPSISLHLKRNDSVSFARNDIILLIAVKMSKTEVKNVVSVSDKLQIKVKKKNCHRAS